MGPTMTFIVSWAKPRLDLIVCSDKGFRVAIPEEFVEKIVAEVSANLSDPQYSQIALGRLWKISRKSASFFPPELPTKAAKHSSTRFFIPMSYVSALHATPIKSPFRP